ncbi:glycoside hydrolase family 3 N-terminal domain-containing protein [Thalassospira xiamenensis]|uniref:beta-N-acetylhexosaminidase n=1 Tax=Thalassospira xiamenensis TaxID=220697 RepID=A0A285TTZ4_9PROT|nr:glycoside hydrolase family 3 N-terminal domain-containing protein [Thalassospira xiamenensis]SOC26819.1 beta-glucosidase [Thalassospira xiamenensis]
MRLSMLPLAIGITLLGFMSPAHAADDGVSDRSIIKSLIATSRLYGKGRDNHGAYILYQRDFDQNPLIACDIKKDEPEVLILVDQEGGPVVRLRSPVEAIPPAPTDAPLMGQDEYSVRSRASGRALRQACIDINLAPVVEPSNPFVPQRSAGVDMEVVERYARIFADAMVQEGVAPVLKHFPGRTTWSKSAKDHWAVADRAQSEPVYFFETVPGEFRSNARAFQAAHPYSVMMSNAIYAGWTDDPAILDDGIYELLRKDLEFDGVVFSDALDELALTKETILSIVQHADMFIIADYTNARLFEEYVVKGLADGTIERSSLLEKRNRILKLKKWLSDYGKKEVVQ